MQLFKGKDTKKILVLAEKSSQAADYAKALGCSEMRPGYIEGPEYVIVYASGQLFTLREPEEYNPDYKKWSMEHLPIIPERFKLKPRNDPRKKVAFNNICELLKRDDIDKVYVATDAGREGELLARYILQEANNIKDEYRVWIDSLNTKTIQEAFKKPKPLKDYDSLYLSAAARNKLDWIIGKNFSRAYSLIGGETLTVGRCQTAVLAIICSRDAEIEKFQSEEYYQLYAYFRTKEAVYNGKLIPEEHADISQAELQIIAESIKGKVGKIADIKEEIKRVPHPLLFNLIDLDRAMYRKYGYTSKQTEDITQKLYEEYKVISYPRTSSRHIKEDMADQMPGVISAISFEPFETAAKELTGKKLKIDKSIADDSMVNDHFALIPLDNIDTKAIYNIMSKSEKDVYSEICLRFIACFYDDYQYLSKQIITAVEGHRFLTRNTEIKSRGWKAVYSSGESDEEVPAVLNVKKGEAAEVLNANLLKHKTQPPPRYNEDLLHEVMDNPGRLIEEEYLKKAIKGHGIGTTATRKDIIETLIERGYVDRQDGKLYSTSLGRYLISLIDIDFLKNPVFTAELEYNLEKINLEGKNPNEFLNKMVELIRKSIEHIKGKYMAEKDKPEPEVESEKLGQCPYCESGEIFSNEKGYGCTNFREGCKFFITKKLFEVDILPKQIIKICTAGRTDFISGFAGKKGTFTAALVVNKITRKIEFEYKK